MARREPLRIEVPAGATLDGFIDRPEDPGPHPAIVVCHGFKGFMEWGFFPHLAELLAERGFAVVRFNFSGSGMRPGEDRVSDLEAFRRNTFTRELEELDGVLEATAEGKLGGEGMEADRLGLLGHSRGGGIALLAAGRPCWRDRVGALVTWAAVSHFDRFDTAQKAEWHRTGHLPVVNSRTGQELPLGLETLEDLETNRQELHLGVAAGRCRAPWLIVHGAEDESVPVEEAHELDRAARGDHELVVVDGGSHTFGAQHPFRGPTPELIQALNATQAWFARHLRQATV